MSDNAFIDSSVVYYQDPKYYSQCDPDYPVDPGLLIQLDLNIERKICEQGKIVFNNGFTLACSVVELDAADTHAMVEISRRENHNKKHKGKHYLYERNVADFHQMTTLGKVYGFLIEGRVAAIGGFVPVNDEFETGRGKAYTQDGKYPLGLQNYFKNFVSDPSLQGKGLGNIFLEPLTFHRVCGVAEISDRPCLINKTNNSFMQIFYDNIWMLAEQHDLGKKEGILHTYFTMLDNGLEVVKDRRRDIYAAHESAILLAQNKRLMQKQVTGIPVVNDNLLSAETGKNFVPA